jgi:hypothetical protein
MHSKKLSQFIQTAESSGIDPVRKAALVGLKLRLQIDSTQQACLRCDDADFFFTWQPLPDMPDGEAEWVPVLGRCGRLMSLSSNPQGGFFMPAFSSPLCTAMQIDSDAKGMTP